MSWHDPLSTDANAAVVGTHGNTLYLASSWKALATAGRPTDLPEGGIYLDGSDPTADVFRVYADLEGTGAADYELGQFHWSALSMVGATRADRSLIGACVQLRGSHPTPAAVLVGHVYEYSGDGRLYVVVDLGGSTYGVRQLATSGEGDNAPIGSTLPAGAWLADLSSAPTLAEAGEASGWKFTATGNKLRARVRVPLSWDGATNPIVRCGFVLTAAETVGDDVNLRVSYKSHAPNTGALANAALEVANEAHDIGANNAQFSVGAADVELDATKITRGHELLLVLSVPTNGGAGNVADPLFTGAEILWPSNGLTE